MDIQTWIVYGGVLILSIVSAYIAQKKNNKTMLMLIVLSLTLVAGLRATSVGIDTKQYTKYFRLLGEGKFDQVYGLETTFMYLCSGLMKIFRDEHFLFAIFAGVTHGFIILRLWDFKSDLSLPWAVACYEIMFFPESLNAMRQLMAMAILFYGTRYISRKEYWKYLLFVAVAFLFHNSALLGLGYFAAEAFYYWRSIEKEEKNKLLKKAAVVAVIGLAAGMILFIKLDIARRYDRYLTDIRFNIGLMLYAKLLFLTATIVLMNRDVQRVERNKLQALRFYYGLGLALTSLGYFIENTHRIGWYFGIMECVYFGLIVKDGKYRRLFQVIVGAVLVYTFLSKMLKGSNGEIPYLFLWQI